MMDRDEGRQPAPHKDRPQPLPMEAPYIDPATGTVLHVDRFLRYQCQKNERDAARRRRQKGD